MSVHQGTHTHAYAHARTPTPFHSSPCPLRMKGGVGLLHATEVCCGQPASSLLCRLGLWTQGQSSIVVFTSSPDLPLQPATDELSLDTAPIHSHDTLRNTIHHIWYSLPPSSIWMSTSALALQDMSILLPRKGRVSPLLGFGCSNGWLHSLLHTPLLTLLTRTYTVCALSILH